jgi:subtilase family serine protease
MPNISGPPQSGYLIETPASLGCVYHLTAFGSGCNPNVVTANPTGGSNAIAVVDAYDDTTAAADLATFDSQFGVTAGTFTKIYGTGNPANGCVNGTQPSSATGTGWDLEEALDVQYAHAMAPGAHIYLVEAASNSTANLLNAEQVAIACVKAGGGGQVSNSWGADEDSGETSNDGTWSFLPAPATIQERRGHAFLRTLCVWVAPRSVATKPPARFRARRLGTTLIGMLTKM